MSWRNSHRISSVTLARRLTLRFDVDAGWHCIRDRAPCTWRDPAINGTPTFFVNEERLDEDLDLASLERAASSG